MGALSRDRIILDGARSLSAPVGVVRDLPVPEAVFLSPQRPLLLLE